jgi:hypothetical protein
MAELRRPPAQASRTGLSSVSPEASLLIEPDITAEEIRRPCGARKATPEEFEEFLGEHEGELLPPDNEG